MSATPSHVCNFDRILFGGGVACTICDEVERDEGCVQEFAGFGPPCSDPLCESCTCSCDGFDEYGRCVKCRRYS